MSHVECRMQVRRAALAVSQRCGIPLQHRTDYHALVPLCKPAGLFHGRRRSLAPLPGDAPGRPVFIGDKPASVQPRLMDLARHRGVAMPLTIPWKPTAPKCCVLLTKPPSPCSAPASERSWRPTCSKRARSRRRVQDLHAARLTGAGARLSPRPEQSQPHQFPERVGRAASASRPPIPHPRQRVSSQPGFLLDLCRIQTAAIL
jgi:hypothetical protein